MKKYVLILLMIILMGCGLDKTHPLSNYKGSIIHEKYVTEYSSDSNDTYWCYIESKYEIGESSYFMDIKVSKYDYDRHEVGDTIK